jgi:hypothetical protein
MEPDPEQGGDPPCWAAQFEQTDEADAEQPDDAEDSEDDDPPA